MGAEKINASEFEEKVLKSDVPVLVDWWATWCGPCKAIAPFIDELADQYAGKVKIVKLNADRATRLCEQYDIGALPTVLVFKGGQVVSKDVGGIGKRALTNRIEAALR